MSTHDRGVDDELDRLVAEYTDRVAAGDARDQDLLEQVDLAYRDALERCFRMIRSGHAAEGPRPPALLPGTRVDGFRIVREIGRGGMAIVYEALQEDLQRRVALKFLRPGLALEQRNVDRFRREALAIARLQHPGIVQIHAVGGSEGQHYIAMELIDGATLAQAFERLPRERSWTAQDLADALGAPKLADSESFDAALYDLIGQVALAVDAAHALGIVHRDLKPSNILVRPDGQAVVADFGLAKGDGDPGLSLTGEPLGTPYYMSPEQAALTSNPVDARSDVYSLGVTLFEGLSGRRPYEGDTAYAVIDAIRHGSAPALKSLRKEIERGAEAIVRRALAKDPDERYANAAELARDLAALARGAQPQALIDEGTGVAAALRRLARTLKAIFITQYIDYTSPRQLLGLPLVQIRLGHLGPRKRLRRATAWLAVGELATGFVAFGGLARGVLAFGGFALGGLTLGGFGLGLVSLSGMSTGGLAIGGMAAGVIAVGGVAWGYWATGGQANGVHAHSPSSPDPTAPEFLQGWVPWL